MEMGSLAPGFQYASAKMASELNIFQQPSPNFGIRRGGVMPSIIVLHYTAMKSSKDAIERLSDPKSEVSAHYLIDEAGKVTQLVDEQKRAWHAGQGCWGLPEEEDGRQNPADCRPCCCAASCRRGAGA